MHATRAHGPCHTCTAIAHTHCTPVRVRAAPQQAELDATLAALGPLFSAALRGAGSGASVPAVAEGEQGVAHAREQLDHRCGLIGLSLFLVEHLRQGGREARE